MKLYTFFKHDGSGRVPPFDMLALSDDFLAFAHARTILAERAVYHSIEVCDGANAPRVVQRALAR